VTLLQCRYIQLFWTIDSVYSTALRATTRQNQPTRDIEYLPRYRHNTTTKCVALLQFI